MSTQSYHEEAYVSLMKGLTELDLLKSSVPSALILIDRAFPLAMNSQGQVLMAASNYGRGRIVVLANEAYLTTFPVLVENAVTWLRGDQSTNLSVGVQKKVEAIADSLRKSSFQVTVVEAFTDDLGVGVYVTDASSVGADPKNLEAFMKEGGGILIGGQALQWASQHLNENTILQFPGNKLSGVAGIYFTENYGEVEKLTVSPQIPSSWKALDFGKHFGEDLEFLLKGISKIDFPRDSSISQILVHGRLAFPIGTSDNGSVFLAGTYYGRGRVIVVSHERFLRIENLASLWKNVIHWLDQGRKGVTGCEPDVKLFTDSGCETTEFKKDLSVFVADLHTKVPAQDIQDFVAEGGGLLIGGHAWNWAHKHPDQNALSDFSGNKILNKMGLTVLDETFPKYEYLTDMRSKDMRGIFHFRYLLRRFLGPVVKGEELSKQEEGALEKLVEDCVRFLKMKAYDSFSYNQVLSIITDTVKMDMPQVSEKNPVNTPRDHALLNLGIKLYEMCPDPDALLPYLIKDNLPLPVVNNQRIQINAKTEDKSEWISTGLYLSPGMKTSMTIPAKLVNKGWKVQISCQTDFLEKKEISRAPRVSVRFAVTSETMQVSNLWGGLIYLVAPHDTDVEGAEVTVEKAVSAPYYKAGVTTAADWLLLRAAPAPWAELEFDNIILSVPSRVIRDLERIDEVETLWNDIMKGVAELAVVPSTFARKERIVADVQISHGLMHAGYPIMMFSNQAAELVNVKDARTVGLWGEIHELGHNIERECREFLPFAREGTCNLWSVYVHEEVLGIDRGEAHGTMTKQSRKLTVNEYVTGGRKLENWAKWMGLETFLQLQDKFGWDAFKKVFAACRKIKNWPSDRDGKMDLFAETFSLSVGKNLTRFFKAWAWPITRATEEKLVDLPRWEDHPMVEYD